MRRPTMSTGAWIFTGLLIASIIAPVGVYAAAAAKVRIVSADGTTDARVTPLHQLLTTTVNPRQVIRIASGSDTGGCKSVYTPPAGKAIVVMSIVYTFGSGTAGTEQFGGLGTGTCTALYDQIDGVQAYDTIEHTFPSGLPLSSVGISNNGVGLINVFILGYLIDATSLPAKASVNVRPGTIKGLQPAR